MTQPIVPLRPESEEAHAARRQRLASLRASITNLPNLLTFARVAAIPAVLVFMDNASSTRSFVAAAIYVAASLTDWFDGYLARRWKQVSLLGKFLDPIADKLIVTAVLVYAAVLGRCPAWLVVLLLGRELAIQGLRSIASSEGLLIAASDSGKQKTALQMFATTFILLHFRHEVPLLGLDLDCHQVGLLTLYLALVMSALSAVGYLRGFWAAIQEKRQ